MRHPINDSVILELICFCYQFQNADDNYRDDFMRRTQRLKVLNFIIWTGAITISLFVIGFISGIRSEFSKSPIDRIGTNNFRFSADNNGGYFVNFICESGEITVYYSVKDKSVRVIPKAPGASDQLISWIEVNDGEAFAASLAAPFALSGREAISRWRGFKATRLESIRSVRSSAKNRFFFVALISIGGYWVGDIAAKKLDIPCRKSRSLKWIKEVDWRELTLGIYNHNVYEMGSCISRLEEVLKSTRNPKLQNIREKITSKNYMLMDINYMPIRDVLEIYPSPSIESYLSESGYGVRIFDMNSEVNEEMVFRASQALKDCESLGRYYI